jgi:hypothetical protein
VSVPLGQVENVASTGPVAAQNHEGMNMPTTAFLEAALEAASKWGPVFPCAPGGKSPLTKHGFKDATTDTEQIRRWWTDTPNANIGLATGERSGLFVQDVDINDGSDGKEVKNGEAALAELTAMYGPLPPTLEAKTPRGGRHLYFTYPGQKIRSRVNHPAQALDVRGDGGYVLISPSVTERGTYTWANIVNPAVCPPWLLALLLEGSAPAEKPNPVTLSPTSLSRADSPEEEARIREALQFIPASDYDTWIKIGMALHSWDQQRGLDLWDTWSRTCPDKYDECEMPKKWESFKGDHPDGVTLGTLFEFAKRGGWSPQVESCTVGDKASDEQVFTELARLAPIDYDRQREAQAKKMKIRVTTLDSEVAKWRNTGSTGLQGGNVITPEVDPWPEPVNGAEVLSAVASSISRYVALAPHDADKIALWVAHAHVYRAFEHTPRLNISSPEKRCGKTLLLDVIALLVPRALRTESITQAVLFRLVDRNEPVLLLDELDTYLNGNDELRGLLNAGHKRGATALRCEGDNHEVRHFNAFAPVVLAGIGALPGTLHDRAIIVRLVRAKPGEVPARFNSRHTETEKELCRKLARWTADNRSRFEDGEPAMPAGAFNRLADNWRPLFAIAEAAGGDWPSRAEAAFANASNSDNPEDQGTRTELLEDIRAIFCDESDDRISSSCLTNALCAMEDKPWAELSQGKPITPNQLARLLKGFGIRPISMRMGQETFRGYIKGDFRDAFSRYLDEQSGSQANTPPPPATEGPYDM